MTHNAVLLDTSFFIRLLNDSDPLCKNADGYFRYFLQQDIPMIISTISIAEYCIGGHINELPLRNLQILPFNLDHAKQAGEFARIIFTAKRSGQLTVTNRNIIPNDNKLFAQAHTEKAITYYVSSDSESLKVYNLLKRETTPQFQFVDLNMPYHVVFGVLDL